MLVSSSTAGYKYVKIFDTPGCRNPSRDDSRQYETDPFTDDRTGHDREDEVIGTKENTNEYAYQWAAVRLVGNAVPLVRDARPVPKGGLPKR